MISRVLTCYFFAILLAGCSPPPPDDVVRACLDELSDYNYTKMLAYAGPDMVFAYSNHIWLSRAHQTLVKDQEVTVEPAELVSSTTAHVRTHITFHQKHSARPLSFFLQVDLNLRDKWYIDDIWHLDEDGTIDKNALHTIPESPFMY